MGNSGSRQATYEQQRKLLWNLEKDELPDKILELLKSFLKECCEADENAVTDWNVVHLAMKTYIGNNIGADRYYAYIHHKNPLELRCMLLALMNLQFWKYANATTHIVGLKIVKFPYPTYNLTAEQRLYGAL